MAQQRRSVLTDLGEELTGIVAPVTLCMALTVGLVRTLNPEGVGDPNAVFLASAYYQEEVTTVFWHATIRRAIAEQHTCNLHGLPTIAPAPAALPAGGGQRGTEAGRRPSQCRNLHCHRGKPDVWAGPPL